MSPVNRPREPDALPRDGEEVPAAVAEILRFMRERPGDKRPIAELSLEAARARTRDLWHGFWNEHPPAVAVVRDARVKTGGSAVNVRVYDPQSGGDRPVFYFAGGGFVVGDLDTHDGIARRLALFSGRPVISVEYRRAPEHPYPAPLEDCVGTVDSIVAGAVDVGIDARVFSIAGDSAGANLALATAVRLRDRGGPMPRSLALMFGCFDPGMNGGSLERLGSGQYLLTARDMRWYWQQYLGLAASSPPPDVALLNANLSGLPATFVAATGLDPLRDDSVALAARLKAHRVPHLFRHWRGMIHGCVGMGRMLNQGDHYLAETAIWLADTLQLPLDDDVNRMAQ